MVLTPDELLGKFNSNLNMVRKHRRGEYKGTALAGEHWENVARSEAVKFGNKYAKATGKFPEGFVEVSKRRSII